MHADAHGRADYLRASWHGQDQDSCGRRAACGNERHVRARVCAFGQRCRRGMREAPRPCRDRAGRRHQRSTSALVPCLDARSIHSTSIQICPTHAHVQRNDSHARARVPSCSCASCTSLHGVRRLYVPTLFCMSRFQFIHICLTQHGLLRYSATACPALASHPRVST
jgi:hypothetical protein